jgi:hypothetical protein
MDEELAFRLEPARDSREQQLVIANVLEHLAGQPPYPQRLFFSRREAETWLLAQL